MKVLLSSVWFVWFGIVFFLEGFIALVLLLFIFSFSKGKHAFNAGARVQRLWAHSFMWPFFMPVKTHGKENLKKDERYIMVCNHQSQLDIPISAIAAPVNFKFLSKKEATKIPVVGYLLKHMHVLVDRSSKQSRQQSMESMQKALRDGYSILIFPEGTRNRGPHLLKDFYDGAFRLAIETGTPIAILTILNSWERQNFHTKGQLYPGKIHCYWDEPIDISKDKNVTIASLKNHVRQVMERRLQDYYGDRLPIS